MAATRTVGVRLSPEELAVLDQLRGQLQDEDGEAPTRSLAIRWILAHAGRAQAAGEQAQEAEAEREALLRLTTDLRGAVHLLTEAFAAEIACHQGKVYDDLGHHERRDFVALAGLRVQDRQAVYGARLAEADRTAAAVVAAVTEETEDG